MTAALEAGYQVHEAVFTADEVGGVLAAIASESISWSRAGARHLLGYPFVESLARDQRLMKIAAAWLGGDALPFKATLFDKNPEANWLVAWHQDTALPLATRAALPGWGPWSQKDGITYAHAPAEALAGVIALRLHLDDSTPDNGPLRVLPGTHVLGVLTDAGVHEQSLRVTARECCARAGGVIAMRPLLIHASSKCKAAQPRRVLHIEYASSMEVAPGITLRAA